MFDDSQVAAVMFKLNVGRVVFGDRKWGHVLGFEGGASLPNVRVKWADGTETSVAPGDLMVGEH